MLTTGTVLQNRYRIVSLLGQGGMGSVYRAWDMRLSVPVALKEMTPQPGIGSQTLGQLRQQFHQEATVLARLNHPHLVRVTDFFEESGNAYLVMDFVEGDSLADRIIQQGQLPETDVLTWAGQLLDALSYCHNQGIIHRDIKPQNVVIRPNGQAVLVDFGLVKLWDPNDPRTRTAMRGMGTPEYAPPEQYEADVGHTDPCSDVYGLGATLYHTLAGQAPLTATLRMATPEQFAPLRRLNPHVSPAMEAAVLKALELPRSKRWQSASEMAAALGIGHVPTPTHPPGRVAPATPKDKTQVMPGVQPAALPRRRIPRWIWISGIVAVIAIFVCAAMLWLGRAVTVRQARATATAQAQASQATTTANARATATAQTMNATSTAYAVQLAATMDAQATVTAQALSVIGEEAQATATVQACIHKTALTPSDWAIILCDPFETNENDWPTGDYSSERATGNRSVTDGKLLWEATALDDVVWWAIPDVASTSDFYLTLETRRVSGVENAQYGVIFRRADSDNYGLFKIEDNQYFKFSSQHNGEWDTVIDWTETTAIRPGETNRMTIIAEGSHFTFYINDQYVGEADEGRLGKGKMGIAIELSDAGDTAVFEFDNFEVRTP
ncbi:MAG: protein kinase [Chloroflexota bacterium]|nr:protein kinase [Chloroflexota bacterium]